MLRRGLDAAKDQSYFLFSLTQEQLSRASFPVGDLSKDAVRDAARRLGLPVAEKPDSQEICFVPDGDYAAFIERKTGDLDGGGAIVSQSGDVLGRHGGVHRFTVGQRKGLGIAAAEPLYVLAAAPGGQDRRRRTAARARAHEPDRISGELDRGRAAFRPAARHRADSPSPSACRRHGASARRGTARRWNSMRRSWRSRPDRLWCSMTAMSSSAAAGSTSRCHVTGAEASEA